MSEKESFLNKMYDYISNNEKKKNEMKKDSEVAETLFEKLGTPKDSKCPHGLEFFRCMSCAH
jgi:hypothetical protein